MFAVPSFDVVRVGSGVSARLGLDEAFAERQDRRRWQAAALILFIGILVSIALLRVDISAQRRGKAILAGVSTEEAPTPGRPTPGRGLWAFVLFVFVAMAVLALSKRWF